MRNKTQYTAAHVTNYILHKARKEKIPMNNIKLQKLLYIFFGWYYIIGDRKELYQESIQAWRLGPVIPMIYQQYKHRRREDIRQEDDAVYLDDKTLQLTHAPWDDIDDETQQNLSVIWDFYKKKPTEDLISLTHQRNTPWWATYDPSMKKRIPVPLIKRYYEKLNR
ncbi:MAG: DUF4065 domain-containing protein [Flavobacteriaceae bacterium]|nr:DUF4065 domain-containing protein [Flavobacteriaceae bacterium]MCY4216358.1 DUF4065 domain-containing protein [Flavobacteriaceae bacterium]